MSNGWNLKIEKYSDQYIVVAVRGKIHGKLDTRYWAKSTYVKKWYLYKAYKYGTEYMANKEMQRLKSEGIYPRD